jgi:hypothetical protein
VWVATDSEWDSHLDHPWLSTAFAADAGDVVFVTPDLPDDARTRLTVAASEQGVRLVFRDRCDGTVLLKEALDLLGIGARDVRLMLYYSPRDIEYATGWDAFKVAIDAKKVRQRNNITGKVELPNGLKVHIKDLSGWAGKTSLVRFAKSLGVACPDKGLMDDFKSCMARGLVEQPETFLRYAVGDARMLFALHRAFVGHFRTLQGDCLGMKGDDLWTAAEIPMTVGALVARTLERWLYGQAPEPDLFRFAVRKLGLLDPDDRRYKYSRWAFGSTLRNYTQPRALRATLAAGERPDDLAQFFRARLLYTGLDGASVRWWASRPVTETLGYNALVHGGRCQREDPTRYAMDRGADVDISGCYGATLRETTYPIGLPTAWGYTTNETPEMFGRWLDRHEAQLVPGLWTATVSGSLGFEQDLIQSKLVKARDIKKAATDDGDEIPGDFVLLRREVHNGILTHDLLTAIRAVATAREWAQIRDLRLVTAVAYLARDRQPSLGAWCEAVIRSTGAYRWKNGNVKDDRSRDWAAVPLEGFVGRLADLRQAFKARKGLAATPEERSHCEGMDATLKLTVNTVYGVLASRFFPVGNTVLANNITGRARLGVWMLAKAMGLRQTITDGGAYAPDAVCHFGDGRRAGFETLSRVWGWHAPHRQRWVRPMNGWDWDGAWPDLKQLDDLAMDHVRSFWAPYDLEFAFEVEHKTTFERAAFWGKADYAFLFPDGSIRYAVRGKDKRQRDGQHPTFALLDNILEGDDAFPTDLSFSHRSILKISKYQVVQSSRGYESLKNHRPGDDYREDRVARYNNTFHPLSDLDDYLSRKCRKKVNRGQIVRWFEKFASDGIEEVHRRMAGNRLSGGAPRQIGAARRL